MYKLNNKNNIVLLKLYYLCYNFRLYSVLAVLYFAQITHSYALALSVFSFVQIAQALFEVPLGYISDKFGRSICLKVGAIANLLSVVSYAFGFSFAILLVGALFEGLNRAAFSGNNDALLYETLKEKNREKQYSHEYGKVNSWLELAGFVSTVMGGILAVYSLSLLFKLSIIPQIMGVLVVLGITEPKTIKTPMTSMALHLKEALRMYITNLKVRYISLASVIGFAIGESTWSFQAVFYNLFLPTWATSLVMSLNFLTSTISFRLSGRLISRFKAIWVLLYTEIYGRTLYLIALLFPSIASPFLIATASVTYGPSTVAQSSILQKEFTDTQRATMSSINSFVGNCFYALVSVFIGFIADNYGPTRAMLLGQIGLLSITFIYFKLTRFSLSKVAI
jgi:MFS family permease